MWVVNTNIYHKKRWMYCIKEGSVKVCKPYVGYSHREWFDMEGWGGEYETIVRGYVDLDSNVYFYIGSDFRVDDSVKETFFNSLKELAMKMRLNPTSKIYGGMNVGQMGEDWKPINYYGEVREFIKAIG